MTFNWIEDVQGCTKGLFDPEETVMFLYTFAEYENPSLHTEGFKKSIVIDIPSTRPVYDDRMSKPIGKVFEWPGKDFLPNETYFVGAMYMSKQSGTAFYSMPEMGETPLFVPAFEIVGLQPGAEIRTLDD